MYKNFDPHKPYFYGVAMALIVAGSLVFTVGLVELLSNLIGTTNFNQPAIKLIGGLIVIALGYIHLELELTRIKTK